MSHLERYLVNSPLRSMLLAAIPARYFIVHSHFDPAPYCLEIGCGQGAGVEIVIKKFKAERVIAFDLDPQELKLARRRLGGAYSPHHSLLRENAAALSFKAGVFDAAFEFGVLHHVAEWRYVLAEIYRVLKPRGYFFYEDILGSLLGFPLFRKFFPHDPRARFSRRDFEGVLERVGFNICWSRLWAASYLVGVAQKP